MRPFMGAGWALILIIGLVTDAYAHVPHQCPQGFADEPGLASHLEHADIEAGNVTFEEIFAHGEALMTVNLNSCDGLGRPATTGCFEKRDPTSQPDFHRVAAPDSNSCASCHALPRAGGGGDFVVNIFTFAQCADPVVDSVAPEFSNERATIGMFGSGPIEMLSREMSEDLQAQVRAGLPDGWNTVTTKGIQFEVLIDRGNVVDSVGVDTDLVIKPFDQGGSIRSLRLFTRDAFANHHGMQAEEVFDLNPEFGVDFDEDGIARELTMGDVSALVIFQAALATPGRVIPRGARPTIRRGEQRFAEVGCASCHVPSLVLDSPLYELKLELPDGVPPQETAFAFDMTTTGEAPRLEPATGGGAVVRAYTDLKRHNLCDPPEHPDPIRVLCNEQLPAGRPDQLDPSGNLRPGSEFFITKKLWDAGNSPPFGHRGDISTITEMIAAHGGEGRASRDAFFALPEAQRSAVVKFIKSFQVLPVQNPRLVGASQ